MMNKVKCINCNNKYLPKSKTLLCTECHLEVGGELILDLLRELKNKRSDKR